MFKFITIMFCGALIGYPLRNKRAIGKVESFIQIAICLLLYTLGVSIGTNKFIIDNIGTFCSQAALIATLSICGILFASWFIYNVFFKKDSSNEK